MGEASQMSKSAMSLENNKERRGGSSANTKQILHQKFQFLIGGGGWWPEVLRLGYGGKVIQTVNWRAEANIHHA